MKIVVGSVVVGFVAGVVDVGHTFDYDTSAVDCDISFAVFAMLDVVAAATE